MLQGKGHDGLSAGRLQPMSSSQNTFNDYVSSLKLPISLLNVFVGIAAILLAMGLRAPIEIMLLTGLSGFLAAGGAGAINCYVDRDLDRRMTRTRNRPIPRGRVPASNVLALGLVLSVIGVGLAAVYLNVLTGLLMGMGVFWYIFVYTLWLKPRTKWNIVIGGAAGSFSALAGWSAATGTINIVGVLVAALIFLWTPGHFWGLAIAKSKDYENGEVPMLPVVDGQTRASLYTAFSNILLFPFTVALYLLTISWTNVLVAMVIGVAVILLNARFIIANIRLSRMHDGLSAWHVFKLSAGYLFIILCLIVFGHIA
jgi:protoheme IX farnesyltransferase